MPPTLLVQFVLWMTMTMSAGPAPAGQRPAAADNTTRSPHGPALTMPCTNCHTSAAWKPIRALPEFDHNKTRYPLRGMHQNVACIQCHTKMVFTNVGTRCGECHADIHRGQFGNNCEQCHTVRGWDVSIQAIQNHDNRFPLLGAHSALDCEACHKSAAVGQFQGLSTQCYSCHQQDYARTNNPSHVQFRSVFSTNCEQCHSFDSWLNARTAGFDHSQFGFALTGAHATLPCEQCHANNNYHLSTGACVSCHLKDFQGTNNPSHVALGFSQTCETCHNTVSWANAFFDHAKSGFPLTGAHATTACTACHVNNNYNITNTSCASCHQKDYNTALTPVNHPQGGFPLTCQQCHDTVSWMNAKFDHSQPPANWALTGAHATVQCALCHVNNNYNLTAANTTCMSCHMKDFNGTTNPNHVQAGFNPQTCVTCHNTTAWQPATFNHASVFPLTGAHATAPCASCHTNNDYSIVLGTTCQSCHMKDFTGAVSPVNHTGFPTTCQNCHDTVSWLNGKFDHSQPPANWALTGFHATMTCTQCHVNNNYSIASGACYQAGCHINDYQTAVSPINHVQLGFPTTCQNCHDTVNWMNAKFDHSQPPANWALTGFHGTMTCAQCHGANGATTFTSGTCYQVGCHINDYNTAVSPVNHKAMGFPTTCETCHDTVNWMNAKFNHSQPPANWPLTGFHGTMTCAQCHGANGATTFTSGTCYQSGCHITTYQTATSPVNHLALGYPTTCESCHDTTNWMNATFNHAATGFALVGFHATMQCTQCHGANGATTFTSGTCYQNGCHINDFNSANNPPHTGFPTDCTVCHNMTSWAGATFNHAGPPANWALQGLHATTPCASCHVPPALYTLTVANEDCYYCHAKDFTGTTSPNHIAAHFPTTCVTCHTTWMTTNWLGAVFNHTWFNMNHGNANGVCATCHTNPNDYSVFQCTVCHGGNNSANFHHPNVGGYVYNSVNCYQCHAHG